MPKKSAALKADEELGSDVMRLESTKKHATPGVRRVFGMNTARALVAGGKWKIVDERYAPEVSTKRATAFEKFRGTGNVSADE